jgi:hypothetical protein
VLYLEISYHIFRANPKKEKKMKYGSFNPEKFWVICTISNPVRFSRRYELYHRFSEYIKSFKVNLLTVELQLGDRPFAVPAGDNVVQLRYWTEIWNKESALQVGIHNLPGDWETCSIADADVEFIGEHKHDWPEEILHELQVYKIIQPWESAVDLGPRGHAMAIHESFMSKYVKNRCFHPETTYHNWHPGYFWSFRREAIEDISGLYTGGVAGAGDRIMALSFIGEAKHSFHPKVSQGYKDSILRYQAICENNLDRDVGYMPGSLIHYWHGPKAKRFYWDRWKILTVNKFDPYTDLKLDSNGLIDLNMDGSHRMRRIRDELREYARARDEDSRSVE